MIFFENAQLSTCPDPSLNQVIGSALINMCPNTALMMKLTVTHTFLNREADQFEIGRSS